MSAPGSHRDSFVAARLRFFDIDTVSILKEVLRSGTGVKYKLLATALSTQIQNGDIEAGTKLRPHRIPADAVAVTIGTVSRLSTAIRTTSWMVTPISFEVASRWIDQGVAQTLLQQQVGEIVRRKKLVLELLAGLNFNGHPESPHFWIEVPEPWRAAEIEAELQHKKYLISTSDLFTVGRQVLPQFVQASVSNVWGDDAMLCDGFGKLASTLNQASTRFEANS